MKVADLLSLKVIFFMNNSINIPQKYIKIIFAGFSQFNE